MLYHNPRCSKSRQTLKLLQQHGIEPEIIEYLKTPPNAKRIQELLTLLNLEPRQLMRKNEGAYSELSLDDMSLSHDQLIQAIVENPKLIERPILLIETFKTDDGNSKNGNYYKKAAIGRPPENILSIL